ncbi:hypothetical protein R1flu_014917 [Riccia fluitans]|uniref:Sm domain-containing protein n=1 Tax=Riccia fluitans TaxID=41844 RepID=A0ABD1YHU8_9MARC
MSGRKETVLDLAKFVDKGVSVKLSGGRQVTGTLKGYDQLLNLVLDEAVENLRDQDDPLKTTDQIRPLGLIVCRGTATLPNHHVNQARMDALSLVSGSLEGLEMRDVQNRKSPLILIHNVESF